MKKTIKKIKLGTCGVDAGLIYLVDPCYVQKEPLVTDPNMWQKFCKLFYAGQDKDTQSAGMCNGVIVNTRHGDGEFNVYGYYDDEGIRKVEVSFVD